MSSKSAERLVLYLQHEKFACLADHFIITRCVRRGGKDEAKPYPTQQQTIF